MKKLLLMVSALMALAMAVQAAPTVTVQELAHTMAGLSRTPSSTDLINGLIAGRLDNRGWHPANTNPADQEAALTDGAGLAGPAGLMKDFPSAGDPAFKGIYSLGGPHTIGEVVTFSGNTGKDGRVFHCYDMYVTSDVSVTSSSLWTLVIAQVRPAAFGTTNTGVNEGALTVVRDNSAAHLATGVTGIRFDHYSVDNTLGEFRDAFDGVNPFTSVNDGLTAAFVSPLILEIDVFEPPTNVHSWDLY